MKRFSAFLLTAALCGCAHLAIPSLSSAGSRALGAPSPFALPPGATLPSDAACAARVRHVPENKRMNAAFNATRGHQTLGASFFSGDDPRANSRIAVRVDGRFTGTTDEILQWAACKWGIDPDVVRAQAAIESWWRQTTLGDWNADPSFCAPGHPIGKDDPKNHPGQCPNSWGILQNKWYYEKTAWPGIERSTAFNADTTYAIWRACYEGYEWWLRDQPPHSGYAKGDLWGCVGRWFSGAWRTPAALQYVQAVRHDQKIRIWEKSYFQEP